MKHYTYRGIKIKAAVAVVVCIISVVGCTNLYGGGTEKDTSNVLPFKNYIEKYEKLMSRKQFTKALDVLTECGRYYKDDGSIFQYRNICFIALNRYDSALAEVEALLLVNPDSYYFHTVRVLLLMANKRDEEAWNHIEFIKNKDSLDKQLDVDFFRLEGTVCYRTKRYFDAVQAYDLVITRAYENRGDDYMERAAAWAMLEDTGRACRDYQMGRMLGAKPRQDIDFKKICK